jgi:hypothetical protein
MAASTVSYPIPVLGNADDISVGRVAATLEYSITDDFVHVDIHELSTGNRSIDGLISAGKAAWVVRLQCARTYFRTQQVFTSEGGRLSCPAVDLEGRIEILVGAVALKPIPLYKPEGLNEEYKGAQLNVLSGHRIVLGDRYAFEVDKEFDPLKAPVASIMKVTEGHTAKGPFEVVLEDDLVEVRLSKEDYGQYHGISNRVPDALHAALVLPALQCAIASLSEPRRHEGLKWADRLRAIAEVRGLSLTDPLSAAQQLLDGPFGRGLRKLNEKLDAEPGS